MVDERHVDAATAPTGQTAQTSRPAHTLFRRYARLVLTLTLLLAVSGCAAYRFGAASLYPPDIHTVYVPVFQSNSFRRNFSELLTEAVCKQIEEVTPYKVVGTPDADSVLTVKLTNETKRVIDRRSLRPTARKRDQHGRSTCGGSIAAATCSTRLPPPPRLRTL